MDITPCHKDGASDRHRGIFGEDNIRTEFDYLKLSAFSAVLAGPSVLVASPFRTLVVRIIEFSAILT
jgi:hypothetical protein